MRLDLELKSLRDQIRMSRLQLRNLSVSRSQAARSGHDERELRPRRDEEVRRVIWLDRLPDANLHVAFTFVVKVTKGGSLFLELAGGELFRVQNLHLWRALNWRIRLRFERGGEVYVVLEITKFHVQPTGKEHEIPALDGIRRSVLVIDNGS